MVSFPSLDDRGAQMGVRFIVRGSHWAKKGRSAKTLID
jgi:hypothetical protein